MGEMTQFLKEKDDLTNSLEELLKYKNTLIEALMEKIKLKDELITLDETKIGLLLDIIKDHTPEHVSTKILKVLKS